MKNILFIMQLPPPIHGASIMNQTIQTSQLINAHYDCTYINLSASSDLSDIGKNGVKKYIRLINIYTRVFLSLFKNDYDLCYITLTPSGIGFIKDSLVVLIAKIFRKKIVFHFHGKGMKSYYQNSNSLLKKYIEFIFKNTDIIHLSNKLLDDLDSIKTIHQKFVLPNAIIPVDQASINEKDEKNNLQFLYLSNMIKTKGVLILLQAAVKLKKNTTKFHVTFIGKFGNEKFKQEFLSFVEDNDLKKFVSYLGPKYDQAKYNALMKYDAFVFPTMNDAFPLVLLEAMQFQLPIISTYEGAIPEIVNDNEQGLLIEKNNPIQLSQTMQVFIENPFLIQQMGQNGRKKYLNVYTIEKFENKLISILEEVICEK